MEREGGMEGVEDGRGGRLRGWGDGGGGGWTGWRIEGLEDGGGGGWRKLKGEREVGSWEGL